MSKVKEFFLGLSKSTKITLISCGCFVLMTLLILIFFVLFPITPSERALASIGRENFIYNENSEAVVTTTPAITTSTVETVTETRTTPAIHSEPLVTFTTVSGFFSEGYIPTGQVGVNYFTTTTTTTTTGYEGYQGEQTSTETQEPTGDATDVPVEDPTVDTVEPTDPPEAPPTAPPVVEPTDPPAAPPEETPPAEEAAQSD